MQIHELHKAGSGSTVQENTVKELFDLTKLSYGKHRDFHQREAKQTIEWTFACDVLTKDAMYSSKYV